MFSICFTDISNDFTFAGDTTYLIPGPVAFNGNVTFEGGAIIKYTLSGTGMVDDAACITLNNSFVMKGTFYLPVIFTATDDDTVGESMWGIDTNYTGTNQFWLDGSFQGGIDIGGYSFSYASRYRFITKLQPFPGANMAEENEFLTHEKRLLTQMAHTCLRATGWRQFRWMLRN